MYRHTWTDSGASGWTFRLDILGYSETLTTSPTTLAPHVIESVESIEQSFDDLPFGLIGAATMTLRVNISNAPSALRTFLRNADDGNGNRTTFLLMSDRGTGSVDYVEFCGVQANIASAKYKTNGRGELVATYDLIDAVHYTLSNAVPSDIFAPSGTPLNPESTQRYHEIFQVKFSGAARSQQSYKVNGTSAADYVYASSWDWIASAMGTALTTYFKARVGRTAHASGSSFDISDALDDVPFQATEWYKCATTSPRTVGAVLTPSTAWMVTHVYNSDDEFVGGAFSPDDEKSLCRYESMRDLFADLAETCGLKLKYHVEYQAGAGNPYLDVRWTLGPVGSVITTSAPSGIEGTIDVTASLEEVEYSEGEAVIGIGETRWKSFREDDGDVVEHRYNPVGIRSQRSVNVDEPVISNVVTVMSEMQRARNDSSKFDFYANGAPYTNLMLWKDTDGALIKAHEHTRIYRYAATYTELVDADAEAVPNTAYSDGLQTGLAEHLLWVNEVQMHACLPACLAQWAVDTFGDRNVCTFSVTLPMRGQGRNASTDLIGHPWTISGTPADLTNITFTRSVCTGAKIDIEGGKITLDFYTVI